MPIRSLSPRRPYRHALVTGASSGIGAAFARTLPKETGLLLVARSQDRLDSVADGQRKAAPGRPISALAADLTDPDDRNRVAEAAEEHGVDLVVNNAGRGSLGPILEADPEDLAGTVALNATAPLLLIRSILPGAIERAAADGRRAGAINVASSSAFAPVPGFATYAASKAFMLTLSEALTAELADRPVDILTLCPGATRSDFGARAGYRGGQLPGALPADWVARAALLALGRQATLVTGPEAGPLAPIVLARSALAGGIDRLTRGLTRTAGAG